MRLTPTEWHIVEVLVRNPGKLVTQRQLLQEVWGPQYGDGDQLPPRPHGPHPPQARARPAAPALLHHRAGDGLPLRWGSYAPLRDRPLALLARSTSAATGRPTAKSATSGTAAPTLLLTTTGRRTGDPTTTPLIFGRDGDDFVLVASRGGAPEHPGWYRNLAKEPEVELQVKGDHVRGRARTAAGDERARLWRQMAEIWPDYDEYATRTEREIPVVVSSRSSPKARLAARGAENVRR